MNATSIVRVGDVIATYKVTDIVFDENLTSAFIVLVKQDRSNRIITRQTEMSPSYATVMDIVNESERLRCVEHEKQDVQFF